MFVSRVKSPSDVLLNEELVGATSGRSGFHSQTFRNQVDGYHRRGDTWTDKAFQLFFAEGLLQHYVAIITKFDFQYNPQNLLNPLKLYHYEIEYIYCLYESFRIDEKFDVDDHDSIKKATQWLELIGDLFNKLKKVPQLLDVGGRYQKIKVLNEKLLNAIYEEQNVEAKQSLEKNIYQNDREMDSLQKHILFHVIEFGYQVKEFLAEKTYNLDQIKKDKELFEYKNPMQVEVKETKPQSSSGTTPLSEHTESRWHTSPLVSHSTFHSTSSTSITEAKSSLTQVQEKNILELIEILDKEIAEPSKHKDIDRKKSKKDGLKKLILLCKTKDICSAIAEVKNEYSDIGKGFGDRTSKLLNELEKSARGSLSFHHT